ncbi:nuclear transport factor 2 family protein [Streptomyces sp. TRM68416]|uniref:nuclear transport factor 2 family protein n=1 Tax=Streptomyces sp. TRM68416 TaxID=2758412 RepID=UPI0016620C6A|nr:nuclear transport factor 2 family protein [Streptomyces sp. TRM68416]MBD0839882.1 nuclear transport factor 2 family protein [Streptomyces sp. TRM68416]
MNVMRAVADRVEIAGLGAELTDAVMMRDFDRVVALFTPDGALRWPHIGKEFVGREEIRAGLAWGQGLWEFFVQNVHPGVVRLDGDTATGRTYIHEFGRMHDGSSHLNHALYHERYRRTADGWRFAERVYEVRYLDSTPLPGSAPGRLAPPVSPARTA